MGFQPELVDEEVGGVHLLVDPGAAERGVLVAFADRRGGVSAAPYDTLNLAARVGDHPDDVAENRRRAAAAASFDERRLALARQVHGNEVIEPGPRDAGVLGEADGLVVRVAGSTAAILTADCAPVVVAGSDAVAVLHAGWRGLVAGVIGAGLSAISDPWAAWIGPSIGACCYEVGPEVVRAFRDVGLPVAAEDRVDPGDAARAALVAAGIDRVAVARSCTHHDRNYFSYRRDRTTGRQGAFGGLIAS